MAGVNNRRINGENFVCRPCPLCGSRGYLPFAKTRDYNWGLTGEFVYVTCAECGMVRQNPHPKAEHLSSCYPRGYGTTLPGSDDELKLRIDSAVNWYRAGKIKTFKPDPGFILDIGCGGGFFLALMKRLGWKVGGLESADEHVDYANNRLGLENVYCSPWPGEKKPHDNVDVITMFHFLEHALDPMEALSQAREPLAKDGILIIETPNIESYPMRIFRRYCMQLDAPRHICLFSRGTLGRCVKSAGFEVINVNTFSPTTMEYTESLRYLLQGLGIRRYNDKSTTLQQPLSRGEKVPSSEETSSAFSSKPHARLFHASERLVVRLCNITTQLADRGCNLFMVARKK